MNKNLNGVIVGLVVIGLVYFSFKKFAKPDNYKVVAKYLDSAYGGDHKEEVAKMGKGYIDSWSKAIMDGSTSFEYDGSTYKTLGGKKIK